MHHGVQNGEKDDGDSAHFVQVDMIIKWKDAGKTKPS